MNKIACFVLLFLVLTHCVSAASIKSMKYFSSDDYFIDLVMTPKGESPASVLKRFSSSGAVYAINGTYFGRERDWHFPVGLVYHHGNNLSVAPVPSNRGYVWFDTTLHITYLPPPGGAIFVAQGGPILIHQKKAVAKKLGNFDSWVLNKNCTRTIIAMKGNRFYIIRIKGSLRSKSNSLDEVTKLLLSYGFEEAMNMDSDSSSSPTARVANSLVVFKKTRPFYGQYKAKHLKKSAPKNPKK